MLYYILEKVIGKCSLITFFILIPPQDVPARMGGRRLERLGTGRSAMTLRRAPGETDDTDTKRDGLDPPVLFMRIIVPGEPVGKGRPRLTRAGHAYTPQKTRVYEQKIRAAYYAQTCGERLTGPLVLTVTAYMQIPRSANRADREKWRPARSDRRGNRIWTTSSKHWTP